MSADSTLRTTDTEKLIAGSGFVHLCGALRARFTTPDFASAAEFTARVAAIAEDLDHHPDVSLGFGSVAFVLSAHDAGGVTNRDLQLAQRIVEVAGEMGAVADERAPAHLEFAIDALNADAVRAFWKAALDYDEHVDDDDSIELVDPTGFAPPVWFQKMAISRTERNRIHMDVYVPANQAEARVNSVLESGGRLVTDEHAPSWWVLADVEGNEACICTSSR